MARSCNKETKESEVVDSETILGPPLRNPKNKLYL
jgi:hypothetical protein